MIKEENMLTSIGTKVVKYHPMTRGDYNEFREWTTPANENPDDEGYLVMYTDGGGPNVKGFSNYISWSPKGVFDRNYDDSSSGLCFSLALSAIKKGFKVSRHGWNGADQFVFLVPGSTFNVNRPPLLGIYEEGTEINYLPHIDIKTVSGAIVPWLASQGDMMAEDWFIVTA